MIASRSHRVGRYAIAVLLSAAGASLGASPALAPALAAGVASHSPRSSVLSARPSAPAPRPHSHHGTATIAVGRLPDSVAVDERNGTVWVANSLDGTVSEISETRQAVIATIKVPASPVGVAADPATGTIWVTCLGPFGRPAADNTVTEISDSTGKILATIKVGQAPFGIAADRRTGMVWVANTNSSTLSEISEKRAEVVATIPISKRDAPDGVAIDQKTGTVWVASLGGGLEELSEATRSVSAPSRIRRGTPPGSPSAIAVDAASGAAWMTSEVYSGGSLYANFASGVSLASRALMAAVRVPRAGLFANIADAIAADPATGTIWVAENGANSVTLISESKLSVARNLPTGVSPVAIAIDSRTSTAWVVNNLDNTVSEYSYSAPRITSPALIRLQSGTRARFVVHARGFPVCVVTARGEVPPGLHLRLGRGAVFLAGTPSPLARGRTYRIVITADNGIGTTAGTDGVTQRLVVEVR
ncbi:MAG TPA: YncE family protein [Streptosporangiaceae bacterium]|nr:YncE family protein [Streptosporangiaceae bacterium]